MSTCSLIEMASAKTIRLDDGSLCTERVDLLARRHGIEPEKISAFETVMTEIMGVYRDGTPRRTVASRQDIQDLRKALATARQYLRRGDVLARLFDEPGISKPTEKVLQKIDRSFSKEVVVIIEKLLPVVTQAVTKDGRAFAGAARRDAKARLAARLLHEFWVKDLRRGRSVQDRGGIMSPGLRFILDCLHEFDSKVKESTIRGFATFKRKAG